MHRILPTLDRPWEGHNKRSVAVVAAFVTDNDSSIHRLRRDIQVAAGSGRSRLGTISVLFVALGRLKETPARVGDETSLIRALDEANSLIPWHATCSIRAINMISSTPRSYVLVKGHVTLAPPIPLRKRERTVEVPSFVKPKVVQ